MKHSLYRTLAVVVLFVSLSLGTASAKQIMLPKIYMFGFAASFNDTIIHFTNVMEVDSAWIETKNDFLLGRTLYSRQLRNHLAKDKAMQQRTCVVMYAKTKAKAEKQLVKLRKLYTENKHNKGHFDVRYINESEFHFTPVNIKDFEVEYVNETPNSTATEKKKKKSKK
jgi:hypothetical protein